MSTTFEGRGTGVRRAAPRLPLAAAVLFAGTAALVPGSDAASRPTPEFTGSVTAVRTAVAQDGSVDELDRRTVTLTVDTTSDLRGRQELHVTWSGATPTGGIVGDPTTSEARNQEYPMVLLQCRGVDTDGAAPKGQVKLSPETCWTQTSVERYVAAASTTPSWRFDRYATAADRRAVVGAPDPLPEECDNVSTPLSARWLPFRSANGTTYPGGPDPDAGCVSLPPETDSAESGGLPSNTTYGVTDTSGKGAADFAVFTSAENGSLGCSPTVHCALVAVPVVGVSCDPWGHDLPAGTVQENRNGVALTESAKATAESTCRRTGAYAPGATRASESTDQAVRGNLWWSASNWRNRITVPLEFATTGAVCDTSGSRAPTEIMGSVVLNELTASWRPAFCTTSSLFPFTHVQQSDSLARTLLDSGEIKAAFSSAPQDGGWTREVVQAPTSVGGFAITFTIDNADGERVRELKLTPRLVAKLLTSSYPTMPVVRDNHGSLGTNPLNITLDPEFQALNPGLPQSSSLDAAAALQYSSASSDLMWALTSWIDADTEARKWLDGEPDAWGMKVNAAYASIALPVDNWPLLDDFIAPQWYQDQNACYAKSPTPVMQLVANPPSNLATVVLNVQYANSAVATVCRYDGYDPTTLPLRQQGRQKVGYRFVLGLTSTSSAQRYNLGTASLGTSTTGFVAPSTETMTAATSFLALDEKSNSWTLDVAALSRSTGAPAYPGTLLVNTVVPTSGLDATTAARLASFLCYTHRDGQVSGATNGQLPAGYLPLTAANGLGKQSEHLLRAALAVRAQAGGSPRASGAAPSRAEACGTVRPSPSPSSSPKEPKRTPAAPVDVPGSAPGGDVLFPPADGGVLPLPAGGDVDAKDTPVTVSTPSLETTDAALRLTSGDSSTLGRLGAPALLGAAVTALLAAGWLQWGARLLPALSGLRRRAARSRR
ncbi:hypothetical protein [Nocardioides yefusunii]|uniref:Uncharacterized protein n=1 Tax=Nocardioides yefusunii TaxID=2500546 RepID=A0ABW1R043_9ACTN|nr:hypothetical protein [Nocardioides yefusunii]